MPPHVSRSLPVLPVASDESTPEQKAARPGPAQDGWGALGRIGAAAREAQEAAAAALACKRRLPDRRPPMQPNPPVSDRSDAAVRESAVQLLSVRDLEVRYNEVQATDALSFDVHQGEFVSLIGPSGCGKSSALRAIAGLLTPSQGAVHVNGEAVTEPRPSDIAYVFQDLALFPWRSALRNVEIALELAGVERRERRQRAMDSLRVVGLSDVSGRFPAQLSGGMRQRVALARALVSDAPLLLFDEPFAALDELSRMQMGIEVLRLIEEHGKTVLFVTHSLTEATYLSDRVIVMTPRPASVRQSVEIELERPRQPELMRTRQFHELSDQLFSLLFEQGPAE